MVLMAVQEPSVYYCHFTFALTQTWIVDDAISSTTSPISSKISGAVIDLFLFSNALAVDRFVKQQAIQQARTKS
jgi:hypothetical protein